MISAMHNPHTYTTLLVSDTSGLFISGSSSKQSSSEERAYTHRRQFSMCFFRAPYWKFIFVYFSAFFITNVISHLIKMGTKVAKSEYEQVQGNVTGKIARIMNANRRETKIEENTWRGCVAHKGCWKTIIVGTSEFKRWKIFHCKVNICFILWQCSYIRMVSSDTKSVKKQLICAVGYFRKD